jgi:prepilin-type processing-associated H-X9-DG protein
MKYLTKEPMLSLLVGLALGSLGVLILMGAFDATAQTSRANVATPAMAQGTADPMISYMSRARLNQDHHNTTEGCVQNMKQIQLAMWSYAQDYDERLPSQQGSSETRINPYLKNDAVLVCPANSAGGLSYAFGGDTFGKTFDDLMKIREACQFVTTWEYSYDTRSLMSKQHLDNGSIIGFLDGHVKWWPASDRYEKDKHGVAHLKGAGVVRMSQGIEMISLAPDLPNPK